MLNEKEITDTILKSLKKEDAPERILIEMLLTKWKKDIVKDFKEITETSLIGKFYKN